MMEDTLINFETAKLAKEKGFNLSVLNEYDYINETVSVIDLEEFSGDITDLLDNHNRSRNYSAPTQSLLQKWLREIHKIIVLVDWEGTDGYFYKLDFKSFYEVAGNNNKNYEDCLELGLQEALKLI